MPFPSASSKIFWPCSTFFDRVQYFLNASGNQTIFWTSRWIRHSWTISQISLQSCNHTYRLNRKIWTSRRNTSDLWFFYNLQYLEYKSSNHLRKRNLPHCVVRLDKRRRVQCAHSRKIRVTRNLPIKKSGLSLHYIYSKLDMGGLNWVRRLISDVYETDFQQVLN